MSDADISQQLAAAKNEVSKLRSQVATFQKQIKRKEKRLAKSTSNAAKLENLLMQTESEADVLRAKCADTEAAVAEARRAEAELVSKMDATSARFDTEHVALTAKRNELAEALAQKAEAIIILQGNVEDSQKVVELREQELSGVREEYRAREEEVQAKMSAQEELVLDLQSRLEEAQLAHEAATAQLSDKQEFHSLLQTRSTEECNALKTKVGDANITIHNLTLRLREVKHDNELKRRNLQNSLAASETSVAQIQRSFHKKLDEVSSLEAAAVEAQSTLNHTRQSLLARETELESAQASLQKLREQAENANSASDQEKTGLKTALIQKSEEISVLEKKYSDEVSSLQSKIVELSHKTDGLKEELCKVEESKAALLFRLQASQNALETIQKSFSESSASWNEQELFLKRQLEKRESELIAEKNAAVSTLEDKLAKSQESIKAMKLDLDENANSRGSLEEEFQRFREEKQAEFELLQNSVANAREELKFLDVSYKNAREELKQVEANSTTTVSELREKIEEASKLSEKTTAECTELQKKLSEREKTVEDQRLQLQNLQKDVENHAGREASCRAELKQVCEEKRSLEGECQAYRNTISQFQEDRGNIAESLSSVYMERDELSKYVEELKDSAANSIREAQEDAASEIAALAASNETLQEELKEERGQANTTAQKLKAAELEVQEKIAQFTTLSTSGDARESALQQEIQLKESNIRAKDVLVKQLHEDLDHLRSQMRGLESENSKLRATVLQSDELLAKTGRENEKFMKAMYQTQAELLETLGTASEELEKSRNSEEQSRTALRLLSERICSLGIDRGARKAKPKSETDSISDLHSEVNVQIVELEELLQAGQYLEVELERSTTELNEQKKGNKALLQDKHDLVVVLDETNQELEEMRLQVVSRSSRQEQIQEEVHSLTKRLRSLEEKKKSLEAEIIDLQKQTNRLSASALIKDQEIADISRREVEANIQAQQLQDLASSVSQRLNEQERAAEVTLTALQRRQKELEAQVEKADCAAIATSSQLEEMRGEKDSALVEFEALSKTHKAFLVSYVTDKLEWRETNLSFRTEQQSMEESRAAFEASRLSAAEEIKSLKKDITRMDNKTEEERNKLQQKLLSMSELEDAKAVLEVSLSKKEEELRKYGDENDALKNKISLFERERADLIESHTSEKKHLATSYEERFHSASKDEDERVRSLKSKIEELEGQMDDQQRESQATLERAEAQQISNEAAVTSLQQKFEAAKLAHEHALHQKRELEDELKHQSEVLEGSSEKIAKLQDELASNVSSVNGLGDKLSSAAASMSALEAKLQTAEETIGKTSTEHAAVVDELLNKISSLQTELNDLTQSKRETDSAAACSRAEMERLQDLVNKLKGESKTSREEMLHLETSLEATKDSVVTAKEMYETEIDTLKQECVVLSKKNGMVQEELEDRHRRVKDLQENLENALTQLENVSAEASRFNDAQTALETTIAERDNDIQKLRSALEQAGGNLAEKVKSLHKANSTISQLSRQIEATPSTTQVSDIGAVQELERSNAYLDRRSGKLAKRTDNLQRSLKRVEKMLALERRKNKAMKSQEMKNATMKRQVSPSTKGLSPSMKRSRDVQVRQPFSPIAANARPPRDPNLTGKHLDL